MRLARLRDDPSGLTLIELMVWIAVFTILAGMAVPGMIRINDAIRLGNSARSVERALQTARLKAVSVNRPMRVRFNCPTAGQFRMLEVIGNSEDTAANRCDPTRYPSPASDNNPVSVPNHDGPVQFLDLNIAFGGAPTLEFHPDGRVMLVSAAGVVSPLPGGTSAVTVVKGTATKSVTVNNLGKIELQR
jgi:prepilin-type N-terminal cleavage/methylation domain-containing protein